MPKTHHHSLSLLSFSTFRMPVLLKPRIPLILKIAHRKQDLILIHTPQILQSHSIKYLHYISNFRGANANWLYTNGSSLNCMMGGAIKTACVSRCWSCSQHNRLEEMTKWIFNATINVSIIHADCHLLIFPWMSS